jgi:ATP-dependent RNA helicase DeaD
VKPGNIVGAIANEAGLDSRYIGHIDIQDDFSLVDLPAGMPKDILGDLRRTRVAGQMLNIEPAGESAADYSPSRTSGGGGGGRRPERDGGGRGRSFGGGGSGSAPPRRREAGKTGERPDRRPRAEKSAGGERPPSRPKPSTISRKPASDKDKGKPKRND